MILVVLLLQGSLVTLSIITGWLLHKLYILKQAGEMVEKMSEVKMDERIAQAITHFVDKIV